LGRELNTHANKHSEPVSVEMQILDRTQARRPQEPNNALELLDCVRVRRATRPLVPREYQRPIYGVGEVGR
jgi:hypothetical protein